MALVSEDLGCCLADAVAGASDEYACHFLVDAEIRLTDVGE